MTTTEDLIRLIDSEITALHGDGGVLDDEAMLRIEALCAKAEDSATAHLALLRRLEVEDKYADELIHSIEARKKARARVRERAKSRMSELLHHHSELQGDANIQSPLGTIYWSTPQGRVEGPVDPQDWPEEYRRVKVEPNKAKAREDLQAGKTIEGLTLVYEPAKAAFRFTRKKENET